MTANQLNPSNEKPYFITDESTSHDAKEALDHFSELASTHPSSLNSALTLYARHPAASVEVLDFLEKNPDGVLALRGVQRIIENQYDLETDLDPTTEEKLRSDPIQRRNLELMRTKKGEEAQASKTRMRFKRLGMFVQGHSSDPAA